MRITVINSGAGKAFKNAESCLDRYLPRISLNTWEGSISQEGVEILLAHIRKKATRQTCVTAFRVTNAELQEIFHVGRALPMNNGTYPSGRPGKRQSIYWKDAKKSSAWPVVIALAKLAGLLHDVGKANKRMQSKLTGASEVIKDPYRHELLSAHFVANLIKAARSDYKILGSEDQLPTLCKQALSSITQAQLEYPTVELFPDESDVWQRVLIWVVLSHHRVPSQPNDVIEVATTKPIDVEGRLLASNYQSQFRDEELQRPDDLQALKADNCTYFCELFDCPIFIKELSAAFTALLAADWSAFPSTYDAQKTERIMRAVTWWTRTSLILGDHCISKQKTTFTRPRDSHYSDIDVYANTANLDGKGRRPNQRLNEHLCRVGTLSRKIARQLSFLEKTLPAVNKEYILNTLPSTANKSSAFGWQDDAVAKITALSNHDFMVHERGTLAFIDADTGSGKTIGALKVAAAYSKKDVRVSYGVTLRSLTLQTASEYREQLKLSDQEILSVIGSPAVERLHADGTQSNQPAEDSSSADNESSATSDAEVELSDGLFTTTSTKFQHQGALKKVLHNAPKTADWVAAPVTVSTIDQLISATQDDRSKHLSGALRTACSDIILDEIDDIDGEDIEVLTRFVYLIGMLGRRLYVCSATLPDIMVTKIHGSYVAGYQSFLALEGRNDQKLNIAMISQKIGSNIFKTVDLGDSIEPIHTKHSLKRFKQSKQAARGAEKRRINFFNSPTSSIHDYFSGWSDEIERLHSMNHQVVDGCEISFGVARFANISSVVAFTQHMESQRRSDLNIMLVTYHGGLNLAARHVVESTINPLLKRKKKNDVFSFSRIKEALKNNTRLTLLVVASPAEEVGKDHDFDWGVLELSSTRSVIQMLGRIIRHRKEGLYNKHAGEYNVSIAERNVKWVRNQLDSKGDQPCFLRPGPETPLAIPNSNHPVAPLCGLLASELVPVDSNNHCDARSRVLSDESLSTPMTKAEKAVIEAVLEFSAIPQKLWNEPCARHDLSANAAKARRFRGNEPTLTLVSHNSMLYRFIKDRFGAPQLSRRHESDIKHETNINTAHHYVDVPSEVTALFKRISINGNRQSFDETYCTTTPKFQKSYSGFEHNDWYGLYRTLKT